MRDPRYWPLAVLVIGSVIAFFVFLAIPLWREWG